MDMEDALEPLDLAAGSDIAVSLLRSPGIGRRSAARFMAAHAEMILSWRVAGLANKDIAGWLGTMGYPLEPSYFRRLIAGLARNANSANVATRGAAVSRRLVNEREAELPGRTRSSGVSGATSRVEVIPAGGTSPVRRGAEPAPSAQPSALNGAELMARMSAMRWVDIDGERDDWSDALTPGVARSFGDLRRRLWEAAHADPPCHHVQFDDMKRLEIPPRLIHDLFAARIACWEQLLGRLR